MTRFAGRMAVQSRSSCARRTTRPNRKRWPGFWFAACLLLTLAAPLAAKPAEPARHGREFWIGKRVIPAHRNVQFTDGTTAVVGTIMEVVVQIEDARENQFLVRSLGRAGWMAAAEAIPLEDAVVFFTARIQHDPSDSDAYHRRGCAWFALDKFDQALADYTQAIRLDTTSPAFYNARAIAWCRKQQYDNALDDYAMAMHLEPANAVVHYNEGHVWSQKGNYAQALASYEEAIRLEPKLGWAYDARAMLLASCQDPRFRNGREAVQSALTACELHQWKEAPQIETLAAAYAEAGDFHEAVRWQKRAMELAPPEVKSAAWSRLQLYLAGQSYRLR